MRRTFATSGGGSGNASRTTPLSPLLSKPNDDEKEGKVKRRQHNRAVHVVVFLTVMTAIFVVTTIIVKSHHHPSHNSSIQRLSSSIRRRQRQQRPPAVGRQYNNNVEDNSNKMIQLPLNSIYRSSVTNKFDTQESLEQYEHRGFTVLAFPTNDFHQELSTNDEIQTFVKRRYSQVTFPIFGLSSIMNNDNAVYRALRQQLPKANVRHNFYKFLVNRRGMAVQFYTKQQDPLSLEEVIQALLDDNDDE